MTGHSLNMFYSCLQPVILKQKATMVTFRFEYLCNSQDVKKKTDDASNLGTSNSFVLFIRVTLEIAVPMAEMTCQLYLSA
jgi:hypothetical protein